MASKTAFFYEFLGFNVFFLIFGLWPVWPNNKYKWPLIIYSFFSIGFVLAIFVSAIFVKKVLEDNALSAAVSYSFLLSILVTHLIIVVQSLVQRRYQMKLIQKFAHVDRLFHTKLQAKILYHRERRTMLFRFAMMLLTFIGLKVVLMIHLYNIESLSSLWYHCLYSIWITRLRCVQVLCFISLLRDRLILMNDKIKEILAARNSFVGFSNDWRPISNTWNTVAVFDQSMPKFSVYDRLINLKQIYGELYEICQLINVTYGWSVQFSFR